MAVLLASIALGATLLAAVVVAPRMGRIPTLAPRPGAAGGRAGGGGRAAVVVAARDEAASIEPAIRSLLASEGATRVVAVDDRSTDATGAILDRIAAEDPRLGVVHVDALPEGWLGKNHALQRGAELAGDVEFLVFTDADVVFAPGGIAAALAHAESAGLDHLAGAPRVIARGLPLAGMVAMFGVLFALFTRPWRVPDPRSRAFVGVGALNVVRREAYGRAGGHAAIRLSIDDDLRLGKAIKESGGRSALCFARDVASVEWYPSVAAMARGLVKNVFAGIEFRVSVAALATAFLALGCVAPAVLALVPAVDGAARALFGATALLQMAGAASAARRAALPIAAGLLWPLAVALFLGILWRSTLTALLTRRVVWRGTAYPLRDLVEFARRGGSRR